MRVRNLTSPFTATDCDSQEARKWRLTDIGRQCVFCGSDQVEAVLAAPEEKAPIILNIGVCRDCLIDSILTRWATVKHQRLAQLGKDMAAAAGEIREARRRARSERNERSRFGLRGPDPDVEAEATRRLADDEKRIVRGHGLYEGWSVDEFKEDMARRWRER